MCFLCELEPNYLVIIELEVQAPALSKKENKGEKG